MDTTKESPVILSLCTGLLRGLEIGIEHSLQRKLHVAAYAEIEAFIVENLLCGMEKGILDAAPIWSDIKTFPFELFRGKVHGIIGGYPCQPFSVAGNQKGTEDPRHLWPYIEEGIEAIRPVFCFFENVRGHLNLGYKEVRGSLQRLGYEVREGIYSAEEVGAPHRRDRLFILAIRTDQLVGSGVQRPEIRQKQAARSFKSSKMGYAYSSSTVNKVSTRRAKFGISGRSMANTSGARLSQSGFRRFRKLREKKRERIHNRPKQPGNELDYSNNCRSKQNRQSSKLWTKRFIKSSCNSWRNKQGSTREIKEETNSIHCWPARPGQDQYSFEEPRIIEPGLGVIIDGYRFREDLLRGTGNGVVWQTASLAFTDLLSKF